MAYDFSKIKVLIVEDNQPMVELVRSILDTFGVKNVISASNGEIGFTKYRQENPDLMLVDWMMKPMNGLQLTEKIRKSTNTPNPYVPIILMTGFSEKRRVLRARDTGVTEFLVKPFKAEDLYKRLVQVIERPRQFVKTEDFLGPDRRRKVDDSYKGPRRREGDEDLPLHDAYKNHTGNNKG